MIKIFFFLVFFLHPSCYSLTLSDIIYQSRILVNDGSSQTRQRYSDQQITAFVNEGQKLFDTRNLCIKKSFKFELAPQTTYYQMPDDFIMASRVTLDYLKLDEITPEALHMKSRQWEIVSGRPLYYYVNFSSRTKIGFYPFPATSSDTGTINIDYFAYSKELSVGSDIPFNGNKDLYGYHYALVYYAAYKMALIDEREKLATILYTQFDNLTNLASYLCNAREAYKPSLVGQKQ